MSVLDDATKVSMRGGTTWLTWDRDGSNPTRFKYAELPEDVVDEVLRLRDGEAALLARCAELERRLEAATRLAWAEKGGGIEV